MSTDSSCTWHTLTIHIDSNVPSSLKFVRVEQIDDVPMPQKSGTHCHWVNGNFRNYCSFSNISKESGNSPHEDVYILCMLESDLQTINYISNSFVAPSSQKTPWKNVAFSEALANWISSPCVSKLRMLSRSPSCGLMVPWSLHQSIYFLAVSLLSVFAHFLSS